MTVLKLAGTLPALAIMAGLGMSTAAQAAPINVTFGPSGAVGTPAPGFSWQGFDFVLDNQPSGAPTAAHEVSGDTDEELDFFLKDPGKVSYKADLSGQQFSAGQIFAIGTKYGEGLTAPTSGYSFIQPFLRNLDTSTPSTAVSLLSGSDAGNPNSPFTGVQLRQSDQGSGGFANSAFVDNVALGEESFYKVFIGPDGETNASVMIGSESNSLSLDLTPGDDGFFAITELLLQIGSVQSDTEFADQFGTTGQKFTFTQASVTPVPVPAALPLLLAGLGGLGLVARRKRKAA